MQHLPTHAAKSNQTATTTSLAVAQNLAVFWQIKSLYLNYRFLNYRLKYTLENIWLRLALLPLRGGNGGIAGLGVFTNYQHIWRSRSAQGKCLPPGAQCCFCFASGPVFCWWDCSRNLMHHGGGCLLERHLIILSYFTADSNPARNLTSQYQKSDLAKGVTGGWQQAFPFSISWFHCQSV